MVISGLGVWLIAPAHTTTLGASGLIFGLFGYLLSRGFVDRRPLDVIVGLIVGVLYGSILWGVLPTADGVSWQAHLFGLIGGLAAAFLFRDARSRCPHDRPPLTAPPPTAQPPPGALPYVGNAGRHKSAGNPRETTASAQLRFCQPHTDTHIVVRDLVATSEEFVINTMRKGLAAAGVVALITAGAAACGNEEPSTPQGKVSNAFIKLGEQKSVTLGLSFDGTPDQIYAALKDQDDFKRADADLLPGCASRRRSAPTRRSPS